MGRPQLQYRTKLHELKRSSKREERLKKTVGRLRKANARIKAPITHSSSKRESIEDSCVIFCNKVTTNKVLIKKTLMLHYGLLKSIQKKTSYVHTMAKEIKKKYASRRQVSQATAFNRSTLSKPRMLKITRTRIPDTVKERITEYYLREDNSRMASGRKETRSKHGQKEQIRYLNFNISTLHNKFVLETGFSVKKSTFSSHRPFYVITPSLNNRNICSCIVCCNAQLLLDCMHFNGLFPTRILRTALNKIMCFADREECCQSVCQKCQNNKAVDLKLLHTSELKFYQWQRVLVENVKLTRCVENVKSAFEVVKSFETKLRHYAEHIFRAKQQLQAVFLAKNILDPSNAVIHIDFSSSYIGKSVSEVQASNFGQHTQVTLHQGIFYVQKKPFSFVTLSDDPRKTAPAVWAHLSPVLKHIKKKFPEVKHITIVSDSPSSQYRNRFSLALFYNIVINCGE